MRKKELIKNYVHNSWEGKGSNLFSTGEELVNYKTTISLKKGMYIIINNEYYSKTTSTNQNMLIEYAENSYAEHNIILTDEKHINGLKSGQYDLGDLIEIEQKELNVRHDKRKFARQIYNKEEDLNLG